jgi:hypothetical protein
MQDSALRGFLKLWENERIGDKEKEEICRPLFVGRISADMLPLPTC